uniref:SJCHGC06677 protein n=2 Tax=Schistosoma japonicum TaxID=6182 RepID=Q5DGD4_SCHJA|nr:SJCHGC06677 protein [Schistosoma japonicum]
MERLRPLNLIHGLIVVTVLACVTGDPSSVLSDIPLSRPNEGLSTASDTLTKEAEAISLDGLSVEQMKQAREQAERRQFEAEVDRMMKIIVNSLYKNKEIFLRELISNASDALDKVRFLSLTNNEMLNESDEMSIRIKADKDSRTLHITDTGIGMTEAELTSNLGTIAKSGTSEFLAKISQTNTASEKSDLIGQFGVGFYSSFLVASKVVVVSKSDKDDQHIWESNSTSFLVYKDPRGNTLKRGTEIILYLTDEAEDYLQPDTLKGVVKKYSQFINFPIYVWSSRVESQPVEPEVKDESKTTDSDSSVEEDSGKKSENKTVEKVIWDWVRVNANKPIWKRKPSDVTNEEYNELFRAYSNDNDDPLAKIHFSGEGDVLFSSILYIPKHPPSNIFQMHNTHSDRIKLYVRRVYISDAAEDLLPKYLAFVFGIVDSDELPLNVSREMLQQNKLLKMIKKRLVKKVIQMIGELTESQFKNFWKEYSVNIKLGIIDDLPNRTKLSKFLRFWTSNSTENQSSLADYVSRMKKGQEEIYYLTAASLNEAKSSPFVERLIKKGYEVIYMVDPVDEYMLQSLTEYEKKRLRNVAKGTIELDKSDEAKSRKEELQKEFKPLLEWFKDNLKEYIDKTTLSERLSNTPCALVANEFGWSGNMERIMTAQAYQRGEDVSSTYYSTMKKVFEINPRHPVMKKLNALIKTNKDDPAISHTANLLFDVAVLRSGFSVKNPVAFAERVESVVKKSLDIDQNEVLDEELDTDDQSEESAATDEMDEESTLTEGSTKETLDTSQINENQPSSPKDEL